MAKKTYTLSGDMPLKRDGDTYVEGDPIELDEAEAAPMVDTGRLIDPDAPVQTTEPQNAGPSTAETDELLKLAQAEVEKANSETSDAKAELAKAQDEIKSLTDKLAAADAEIAKLKKPPAPKGGGAKK
jgi:hypothetical protein